MAFESFCFLSFFLNVCLGNAAIILRSRLKVKVVKEPREKKKAVQDRGEEKGLIVKNGESEISRRTVQYQVCHDEWSNVYHEGFRWFNWDSKALSCLRTASFLSKTINPSLTVAGWDMHTVVNTWGQKASLWVDKSHLKKRPSCLFMWKGMRCHREWRI